MKKIVLVSCGSQKQEQQRLAREMYVSLRFKEARKYAERVGDLWFILSAKHVLLPPKKSIAPYNKTLLTFSAPERREWSEEVMSALAAWAIAAEEYEFILLAGERYCEFLQPMLCDAGFNVSRPLEGLRQGEQLARLQKLNEAKADGLS